MQLDDLYQDIILDHYKQPRGRGLREPYQAESHQVNPTCGDEITVRVGLTDDGRVSLSYDGVGCSISQAAASVLYELVNGRPVEPDEELLEDGVAFAGVAKFPARIKCALLAWMAFKDAAARAADTVPGGA